MEALFKFGFAINIMMMIGVLKPSLLQKVMRVKQETNAFNFNKNNEYSMTENL